METRTACIRALNDRLRRTGQGGVVVMTRGVAALPNPVQAAILAAMRGFDNFSVANDPHGEHDFGLLQVAGHQALFKIDYFDPSLCGRSADPADPIVTRRVLTVMLTSEY